MAPRLFVDARLFGSVLAGVLIALSAGALADPAVNATKLTCAKVKDAIRANGSAIVHYATAGSKNPLYARYVSDSRFCGPGEAAVLARVPTADKKACPVKRCESVF